MSLSASRKTNGANSERSLLTQRYRVKKGSKMEKEGDTKNGKARGNGRGPR